MLSLGMMISCDCPEFSGGCTLMATSLFCAWGMGHNPHALARPVRTCVQCRVPELWASSFITKLVFVIQKEPRVR